MYLYFDKSGILKATIPHGEIIRQGGAFSLYFCFDYNRFNNEEIYDYTLNVMFTLPDGTNSDVYYLDPNNDETCRYLGLKQFNKLIDSEMTFGLIPGVEYHVIEKEFYTNEHLTDLFGKLTAHLSLYKNGKIIREENAILHVERTIGNQKPKTVITPDEYEYLVNVINDYIEKFNSISLIKDVDAIPDQQTARNKYFYRLKTADGYEYWNKSIDGSWYRFVTSKEIDNALDLIAELRQDVNKNTNDIKNLDENRIKPLESAVKDLTENKINKDFSGLGVASSVHKNDTVIVRCAGCDGKDPVTYTLTVGDLTALINSEVDYFKGYHASLAALQTAHPTGEPGDYAFVATEKDDQYHMYVWDEEQKPGRWEETISGQYLLASSFETFQERLAEGTIHVGAVKGNVNDALETDPLLVNLEINGNKYILPSLDLDFLGDAVEGAYKLGAIKINGDTWNINNDIIKLEISDENVEGAYELGSMNINGNIWNVAKLSFVEEKIAELKAYLDANSFNKGEFLSLEKLQEKHPDAKPGEFAFVNTPTDQGDVMLMYVWDEDANTWKETTSQQYVLNSEFENFKEEINEEINSLWDDVDALWEKGGGGVKSLFNVIRYDELTSEQIYEVPVFYKGNIPISPKKTQNIKGFYINKQLDNEAITMLIAYMLLTNNLINSVDPFINGNFDDDDSSENDWLYFAESYDEENDCFYDLYVHYEINVDNQNIKLTLGCDGANGFSQNIWDNEDGWYSDAPDYVEMGFDFYANSNELGLELMSNIFSVDPFETYEFELYHVDSSYYNMSIWETPNWDGTWYRPWNKINGGSATSSSASAFVDVKSLETKIKGSVIPQTGKVDTIYFNVFLSNEEIIDIVSKLEVGESMPQYYIFISDDMSIMLRLGIQAQPTSELGEIESNATYYISIVFNGNEDIVWNSENGWDPNGIFGPDLVYGLNFGVNLITPEALASTDFPADGHCGDQNDLLVSIVSTEKGNFEYTEPKEIAVGNKDKVYRTVDSKGDYTYHQIKNDEWEYFGGNIIPVNNLSDAEKLVGTPITKYENAGPVTVYINKTLTNEQVQELCSKVYYDNTGRYFVSGHFNCMGFVMIANASLQPTSIQGDAQDNYQIFAYNQNTDEEIEIWSTSEGWSSNCPDSVTIDTNLPMETSVEPLSEEDAEEFVGKYNDLIKDLLSATPFKIGVDKKAIYRVKEEKEPKVVKSALPAGDSGATFDKFYLNMNLSPEEMLKIFQSVEYRALSYDYKNHYIIHTLRHPDPNNSLRFQYTLQIIQLSDTQYNLVLSEWVYNSSDTKYILCSYDNGVVEWASDISNFVNSDGSLKTEWVGNKFWDKESAGELGYSIGSENHKLIDLIYLQSTEEVYDYAYHQYTSNGWERYGSSIVSVKELPSDNIDKKAIYRVAKEIPQEPIIVKNAVSSKPTEPEKIYIDRTLSIEQVVEILSKLNYSVSSANGNSTGHNIIYVGFNPDTRAQYMLYAHSPFNNGQYAIIIRWGAQDENPGWSSTSQFIFDDENGWYSDADFLFNEDGSIKEEFTGEFATQYYDGSEGIWDYSPVASQNDLVKDLIYVQKIEQPEATYEYEYYRYIKNKWVKVLEELSSDLSNNYVENDTLYLDGSNYSVDKGVLYMNDSSYVRDDILYIIGSSSGGSGGGSVNVKIDVDDSMSDTSKNPVQNKIVKAYIDEQLNHINEQLEQKQNKLTAGTGITISEDGIISISYPLAEEEEY